MAISPVVVLIGGDDWAAALEPAIREQGYTPMRYEDRARLVARLADDHAALILVDGDHADWRFWTTTPKTNPATRRIPIILISSDPEIRAEALIAGADVTFSPDEFLGVCCDTPFLEQYARIPDPAVIEQMEQQCGAPLPPEGLLAVQRFNAGEYYKQHDLFEAMWMAEPGPVRDLYRAVLQVGIAYYQITRGNHQGALKMLLRSGQWLNILPDVCQGVDVRQLREDAARVRAALERTDPADIASFDRSLLKPVRMVEDNPTPSPSP